MWYERNMKKMDILMKAPGKKEKSRHKRVILRFYLGLMTLTLITGAAGFFLFDYFDNFFCLILKWLFPFIALLSQIAILPAMFYSIHEVQ